MQQDWQRIKALLMEAIELEPPRRDAFLSDTAISPEIRAEVRSLLEHEDSAKDFMSITASGFACELTVTPASHLGQQIGVYETISELGLGGMGVVYLAQRRDGKFEQKVAIKMLKRELNTEKVREIFQHEKTVLATLSHPNIANLLDAGTTGDGIPYLVMEYIDGEPIDTYCQTHNLSLEARLKLFNKVCDTVARAHRSLVVHRDLKPSNILVTKEGVPKLLDFGIAKLLDVDAKDSRAITQLGAMTPDYASPEQLSREPVSTTTDVYSLGVVLFKILTGSLPGRKGFRSHLKGDLDNVVLKALRPEPHRRYQSVDQLSDDIWRFIDYRPVRARPATVGYRTSKFVARNKIQVIAATCVVIALLVGISVAVYQARSAHEQARLAREQRDAAQSARERAEKTSRFLQSFLDYANPNWYARGKGRKDVTVREAIDDAASRIDTELADQIEVRADLHYTIGDMYLTHREPRTALDHFQKSYDLYRHAFGERHPMIARAIYYLSIARHRNGSSVEDSEKLLREGVAMMRETDLSNVNLPYMLETLSLWIVSDQQEVRTTQDFIEAEAMAVEANSLFTQAYGKDSLVTLGSETVRARIVLKSGDLDRAITLFKSYQQKVEARKDRDFGGTYAWSFYYAGEAERSRGKESEAEASYKRALELGREVYGEESSNYGSLLAAVKKSRSG